MHFEQEWQKYSATLTDEDLGAQEIAGHRKSFFAGALTVLKMLETVSGPQLWSLIGEIEATLFMYTGMTREEAEAKRESTSQSQISTSTP